MLSAILDGIFCINLAFWLNEHAPVLHWQHRSASLCR